MILLAVVATTLVARRRPVERLPYLYQLTVGTLESEGGDASHMETLAAYLGGVTGRGHWNR